MNVRLDDSFRQRSIGPISVGGVVSEAFEALGLPEHRGADLGYPGLTLRIAPDRSTIAGFRVALREERPLIPFVDLERFRAISQEEAARSYGLLLSDDSDDDSPIWERAEGTSVGLVIQQISFDKNGQPEEVEVFAPGLLRPTDDAFNERARERLPASLRGSSIEDWLRGKTLGPIALGARAIEASHLFGSAEQGRPCFHYPGLSVKLTADRARVTGFAILPREEKQIVPFADLEKWRTMTIEEAQRSFGFVRKDFPTPHDLSTLELETPSPIGAVRQVLFFSWYRRRSRLESIHVSVKERRVPPGEAAPPIASPPERMISYLPEVYEPPERPTGERLLDWLLEGRLGPLPMGSTLDDVIALFGEPMSHSSPSVEPPILKYPALEVFASRDHEHLAGFHIQPDDVEEAVPYGDLNWWLSISVDDVEKLIGEGWERSVMDDDGKESVSLSRWVSSPLGEMRQSIHFKDDIVTSVGLLAGQSGRPESEKDKAP